MVKVIVVNRTGVDWSFMGAIVMLYYSLFEICHWKL